MGAGRRGEGGGLEQGGGEESSSSSAFCRSCSSAAASASAASAAAATATAIEASSALDSAAIAPLSTSRRPRAVVFLGERQGKVSQNFEFEKRKKREKEASVRSREEARSCSPMRRALRAIPLPVLPKTIRGGNEEEGAEKSEGGEGGKKREKERGFCSLLGKLSLSLLFPEGKRASCRHHPRCRK